MIKVFRVLCLIFIIYAHSIDDLFSQSSTGVAGDSTGYLKVSVLNQDSVFVVINEDFGVIHKIASGDTLALTPGKKSIRIIKQNYIDLVRNYEIEERNMSELRADIKPFFNKKELSRKSSYPRIFWRGNNFILTDPNTELYIDGTFAGRHYAVIDTVGNFKVTAIHESGEKFTKTLQTDEMSTFNFYKLFAKPDKKKARLLSFVPGGSQIYKGQMIKGIGISVAAVGGLSLAIYYESRLRSKNREFRQLNTEYLSATDPEEVFILGLEVEKAFNESVKLSNRRNNILLGTTIVYLANIVDGFIAPQIGFRNESLKIDPYFDLDSQHRQPVIGIKSSF